MELLGVGAAAIQLRFQEPTSSRVVSEGDAPSAASTSASAFMWDVCGWLALSLERAFCNTVACATQTHVLATRTSTEVQPLLCCSSACQKFGVAKEDNVATCSGSMWHMALDVSPCPSGVSSGRRWC